MHGRDRDEDVKRSREREDAIRNRPKPQWCDPIEGLMRGSVALLYEVTECRLEVRLNESESPRDVPACLPRTLDVKSSQRVVVVPRYMNSLAR